MKIISASATIMTDESYIQSIPKLIEAAGRTCYKSEDKITDDSADRFIRSIIKRGHESVLEHGSITVRFIVNRGVSHEIVRHRIASYSQESTRYCNYSKDKFDNELTFIYPFCFDTDVAKMVMWEHSMKNAETYYFELLKLGATPEEARDLLPNALKTEIVVTMNIREWRHFFKLRCAKAAHPQMREVAIPLLAKFKKRLPCCFEDIEVSE